jgi:hypothetical protein
MQRQPDHAPVIDDEPAVSKEELRRFFELASRAGVNLGRTNDTAVFQKWMLGITSALIVSGVGGAVLVFGEVSALREEIHEARRDIDRLYKLVEPRLRGGSDADSSHQ